MSAAKKPTPPRKADLFDPANRTVANRIYYALSRVQLLHAFFDDRDKPLTLDYHVLEGLCDALDDIERGLEPLTEGRGDLPEGVDQLMMRDVLLPREEEWRQSYAKSEEAMALVEGKRCRSIAGSVACSRRAGACSAGG